MIEFGVSAKTAQRLSGIAFDSAYTLEYCLSHSHHTGFTVEETEKGKSLKVIPPENYYFINMSPDLKSNSAIWEKLEYIIDRKHAKSNVVCLSSRSLFVFEIGDIFRLPQNRSSLNAFYDKIYN